MLSSSHLSPWLVDHVAGIHTLLEDGLILEYICVLYRLAEELADSIVETRNYLGPAIMPLDKYHVFSRGIFEVNEKTVVSGQYYQVCGQNVTRSAGESPTHSIPPKLRCSIYNI